MEPQIDENWCRSCGRKASKSNNIKKRISFAQSEKRVGQTFGSNKERKGSYHLRMLSLISNVIEPATRGVFRYRITPLVSSLQLASSAGSSTCRDEEKARSAVVPLIMIPSKAYANRPNNVNIGSEATIA